MSNGQKALIVVDLRHVNSDPKAAFRVKEVRNSTDFIINQYVSAETLNNLNDNWTYKIVERKY